MVYFQIVLWILVKCFPTLGHLSPRFQSFLSPFLVELFPISGQGILNTPHFCVFSVSLILLSSLYLHIGIAGCSGVCILIYSPIQALECLYTCIPVYRPICICVYSEIQVCTYPAVSIYANTGKYANTRIRDSAY